MVRSRHGRSLSEAGNETSHAHVLGVGGRGMAGLAQSLAASGLNVSASGNSEAADVSRLQRAGIKFLHSSAPPYTSETRLLIHGPEIRREHPARLGALKRGIRQETPASWLAEKMRGRIGVALVGGREASVSAAMIALVLDQAGHDPSVFLGTPSPQLGGWTREGSGPHLVAAWAGDATGLGTIKPSISVLLNLGADPSIDRPRWASTYQEYLAEAAADSHILALGHPSYVDPSAPRPPHSRHEWLALERGGHWWGADLREESGRFRFRIFHLGRYVMEVRLQVPGRRNVASALAAAAVCERLGVPSPAIRQGLEDFTGLKRDFESRGSYRGVSLVDDESEDAFSVQHALATARKTYGSRRLWSVYAPPSTATAPDELCELLKAFSIADRVLITARQTDASELLSEASPSRILTQTLAAGGVRVSRASSVAQAISDLDQTLEPGDVLLTLGTGDVGTIADAFIRRLPRDRQDG